MLAVKGKEIITITNGVIEDGVILIEDEKIKDLGPDVKIPDNVKVLESEVVMPGLVEAHCHIGIWEEKIGWAGSDGNEMTEPATPHMRAIDAIKANAEEGGLEAALYEGITTAQVLPGSANVIGGTGLVLKTAHKPTIDQMVIKNPSGMKIAFGENPMRVYGKDKNVMPSTRMGVAGVLRDWLLKTRNYMDKKEKFKDEPDKLPEKDIKLESMEPVLRKEIPFRAHAHRADDVATAIRICDEFDVNMSWEHATEGHRIAGYIADKKIPAVWGPSLTARGKWEMRELRFETPLALYEAGVKFAIQTDAVGSTIRFLPICAALAVKAGLPYEYALKAITIIPAEIMGVDDRVGSIEKGKDADLRLLTGDPLEYITKCEKVIIDGKLVSSNYPG
ncbi:amidohydrolase family protein [Candidatus Bathyarchaeota archaeon]|nr:amidohydrolase family protein [Candidatus Bathyarchaeota archaeon]